LFPGRQEGVEEPHPVHAGPHVQGVFCHDAPGFAGVRGGERKCFEGGEVGDVTLPGPRPCGCTLWTGHAGWSFADFDERVAVGEFQGVDGVGQADRVTHTPHRHSDVTAVDLGHGAPVAGTAHTATCAYVREKE